MAVVLAAGSLAISSCESGDTIVSVNYSFDDATAADVKMNVAKLHIEIKAGGSVQTDIDIMRDPDAGTITNASYKRVKVDGLSGEGTLTVTALDSSNKELMTVKNVDENVPFNAPFTIESHEVTSAYVKFAKKPTPTGGAGGGGTGSGGSTDGSGGSTDGSGGSSGSGGSGSGSGGSGSGGSTN